MKTSEREYTNILGAGILTNPVNPRKTEGWNREMKKDV